MSFEMTRTLVKAILQEALEKARALDDDSAVTGWSVQGFGMLRRHLPGDWRLNVWDSRFRVKDVSLVHDHPWHFESLVVSGRLVNRRFWVYATEANVGGELMEWAKLKPGPGGGLLGQVGAGRSKDDGGVLRVVAQTPEAFRRGDAYSQLHDEVHRSDPEDGCVTLNRRRERLEVDEARVFWPVGTSWVSAEPRDATAVEVTTMVRHALEGWER